MAKRDSLRRRPPHRRPLPRILIVCEGTRTEPSYFQDMRRLCRSPIDLELSPGGTPKTLVERAAKKKKEATKLGKKDRNLLYDSVWCVFDVDEHPFLPEAKEQATANGIHLAVSNPCFELWLLLHFQDQRAHIERDRVQRLFRDCIPDYGKDVPCERLLPLCEDAVQRAQALEDWQNSRGCAGNNPSTGVHRLLQLIKDSDHPRA
jgi:hypothetical protein